MTFLSWLTGKRQRRSLPECRALLAILDEEAYSGDAQRALAAYADLSVAYLVLVVHFEGGE